MDKPTFSDVQLTAAVAATPTLTDCVRFLGLVPGGATRKTLRKHIARLGLNTSHWIGKRKPRRPDETVFVENSNYANLTGLKKRLLLTGALEYKCYGEGCGLTSWLGKPITLQLHHKNGNQKDHRLENLELRCPNCHSQTDTYAGKNRPTP